MSDLLIGSLGVTGASTATADEPPQPESETMSRTKAQEVPIADQIIDAITDAGGSISASDLAEALPHIEAAARRYQLRLLGEAGKITRTGTTSSTTYSLADSKAGKADTKSVKRQGKKSAAATDQTSETTIVTPTGERYGVSPAHLRRLLALALRAPGAIADADRQALALRAPGAIADADRQALAAVAEIC